MLLLLQSNTRRILNLVNLELSLAHLLARGEVATWRHVEVNSGGTCGGIVAKEPQKQQNDCWMRGVTVLNPHPLLCGNVLLSSCSSPLPPVNLTFVS